MTDTECPECSASVRLSLPRSATVHSVVVSPAETDRDHGVEAAELDRPRELRKPCPNGHPLAILYDW